MCFTFEMSFQKRQRTFGVLIEQNSHKFNDIGIIKDNIQALLHTNVLSHRQLGQ